MEIKNIMDRAYVEVKEIIEKNRDKIENLKDALLKYETLDGEEVKLIIAGGKLDKPTVGDLLEEEKRRQAEESAATNKKTRKRKVSDDTPDVIPKPEAGF